MRVKELIAELQKMDPEVQVAFFSRFKDDAKYPAAHAEVVVQAVECAIPHRVMGKTHIAEAPVRVACLNPSLKALDYKL